MADQVLQEIKDRLNVVDLISGYIQLKKAGVNFKALCPFHSDKNPSLMISPQKQIWHCFSCGEGGDVFGFVMKFENVEFREALKILADKAGVQLPQYKPASPQEQSEKELLLRINDFAARFYHQVLIKDTDGDASNYLNSRGLTSATIKKWQIGYAPEGFHALEQALAKKKVSLGDAIKAGVLAKNERGQIYDRFRDRVTFPIFDYHGNIVGFSARILHDDGKSAKYVNSPETVTYNKSKVLFGLNFAKNSTRKLDEAVVVEGQMDCVTAHQAGFENVVASSGTALTSEQLISLSRLTKNLKFCFDSDAAGQSATRRAGELALKQAFRLKIIILDKVKDPDELIKKSPGLWEKAVKEAQWFLDYQMDIVAEKGKDPIEQKHYLSQEVIPLLSSVTDPLEQDHYVRQLVTKFNISERVIRDQIKNIKVEQPQLLGKSDSLASKTSALEKEVLGGMLQFEDFYRQTIEQVEATDFEDPEIRKIIESVIKNKGLLPEVKETTVAKEAIFMVESQLDELEGNADILKRQLLKSFALIKLYAIKKAQHLLTLEIKQAESLKDKQKIDELNKKFAEAAARRMEFEKIIT